MGLQIRTYAGKVASGFFNALFADRDGHILFLHDAVACGGFIHDNAVVLYTEHITAVLLQVHKHILLKVGSVQTAVVDGDLGNGTSLQTVQHLGVVQKHDLFIILAGYLIVNIRKPPGAAIAIPGKKNTVIPDPLDGNDILHPAGNTVFFLILF